MNPHGCAPDTFLSSNGKAWIIIVKYCKGSITSLPGDIYVAFRVLEPYAVKVASPVLRRERRGNPPDLSDVRHEVALYNC